MRLPVEKLLSTGVESMERVSRLAPGACVIVIGFPRYLRALIDLLSFARRRGLLTIAITDSPFSALKGDINLFAPAESSSFVAFPCAPLTLINALIDEISRGDSKATLKSLRDFEAWAEEIGLFQVS